MSASTPGPAAIAAAEWWAEAVGHPVHRITDDKSGPDDQRLGGDYAALAALVGSRAAPVTSDKARAFADAVAETVQSELERYAKLDVSMAVTLAVDYGPDHLLGEAARASGIAGIHFPSKTCMWIREDHVTVSAGYRAMDRLVWASPEWHASRPECLSQKWDETLPYREGYHGEPFACSLPIYHDGDHAYDKPISLCAECGASERWPDHRADSYRHHAFRALPPGQRAEVRS